jgi:hypothetical protein
VRKVLSSGGDAHTGADRRTSLPARQGAVLGVSVSAQADAPGDCQLASMHPVTSHSCAATNSTDTERTAGSQLLSTTA